MVDRVELNPALAAAVAPSVQVVPSSYSAPPTATTTMAPSSVQPTEQGDRQFGREVNDLGLLVSALGLHPSAAHTGFSAREIGVGRHGSMQGLIELDGGVGIGTRGPYGPRFRLQERQQLDVRSNDRREDVKREPAATPKPITARLEAAEQWLVTRPDLLEVVLGQATDPDALWTALRQHAWNHAHVQAPSDAEPAKHAHGLHPHDAVRWKDLPWRHRPHSAEQSRAPEVAARRMRAREVPNAEPRAPTRFGDDEATVRDATESPRRSLRPQLDEAAQRGLPEAQAPDVDGRGLPLRSRPPRGPTIQPEEPTTVDVGLQNQAALSAAEAEGPGQTEAAWGRRLIAHGVTDKDIEGLPFDPRRRVESAERDMETLDRDHKRR